MKGQILFVRPPEHDDLPAIEAMHAAAGVPLPSATQSLEALVGRLAGTTVAYLEWRRVGDAMEISHILVSAELRGVRIGRSLMAEAAKLAAEAGADTLRVAQTCELARYFERSGFVAREGSLIKTIH